MHLWLVFDHFLVMVRMLNIKYLVDSGVLWFSSFTCSFPFDRIQDLDRRSLFDREMQGSQFNIFQVWVFGLLWVYIDNCMSNVLSWKVCNDCLKFLLHTDVPVVFDILDVFLKFLSRTWERSFFVCKERYHVDRVVDCEVRTFFQTHLLESSGPGVINLLSLICCNFLEVGFSLLGDRKKQAVTHISSDDGLLYSFGFFKGYWPNVFLFLTCRVRVYLCFLNRKLVALV